ncbi:hypothetical protein C9J47_13580 [Photobacterium indicum]|uniref:Uncharacterized protein n=1 Tax=Photobacterium indicum TaxID=81447 RepID=A0A2T3L7Z5_9GAMM|nr:hypothetical protein C9J47_13580 [Photobacterium indicum]
MSVIVLKKVIKRKIRDNKLFFHKNLPRSIKLNYLAKVLFNDGFTEFSHQRLPHGKVSPLSLDIQYKLYMVSEKNIKALFIDNKEFIIDKINRFSIALIIDFIKTIHVTIGFSKNDLDLLLCKSKKKKKSLITAYIILFELDNEIEKEKNNDNKYINRLKDVFFEVNFNIENTIDKDKNISINEFWITCEFDRFISEYSKIENPNLRENLQYYFVTENHHKVINIYNNLLRNKEYKSIQLNHTFFFYSYMSICPERIADFFNEISVLNMIKYEIFSGYILNSINDAEECRRRYVYGLQSYLDIESGLNYPTKDELARKKVLIISESGVGDEVRWAKLYSRVNNTNITITCEPRLYELLKNSFSNINFLSVKRCFRGDGSLLRDFHRKNLPMPISQIKNDFDHVITTGSLINVLGEDSIKASNEAYIKPISEELNNMNEIRIGIIWSSGLKEPFRQLRYLLSLEDIIDFKNIYSDRNVKFIALQSPISENDKQLCEDNGIIIPYDVDLYNDFVSTATLLKTLNCVVGMSSFITEFAASLGIRFFHMANSPEVYYMRSSGLKSEECKDVLSNNTLLVIPDDGFKNKTSKDINFACFRKLKTMVDNMIEVEYDKL